MSNFQFRVWDKYHTYCKPRFWYSQEFGLSEFFAWCKQHNVLSKDIQQFTGALDEKTRGIYAGDKVLVRRINARGFPSDSLDTGFVVYDKNHCAFMLHMDDGRELILGEDGMSYEVVGTIYDVS